MNSRIRLFGFAALGAAVVFLALLLRRRFRAGFFLLPIAVALAEKWREERDLETLDAAVSAGEAP